MKKQDKPAPPSLVDQICSATAEDLAAIDERIAAIQGEIDAFVGERRKQLDALTAVRKSIDIRVNGKPARKKPERKSAAARSEPVAHSARISSEPSPWEEKIYDLLESEGSMPSGAIAERLGTSGQQIGQTVRHSTLFKAMNGEVHIAKSRGAA